MRLPRRRLSRLAIPLLGVALLAWSGCSDVSVSVINVADVEVSPATLTLFEEEEEIVSAVLRSAGGEILPGRTIQWSTGDPGVAVVSPAGVVRGKSRGTTTVRAESEGVVGTAAVTVLRPPTIGLSRSEVTFHTVSGADDPPGEEVGVMNEGDGDLLPLSVSVEAEGPEWLSASIADFAAPTTLTVNVAAAGLSPGHYEGSVLVASPAAANSPRSLRVVLEVEDAPPEIDLDPTEIEWDIVENIRAPSAEVAIENRGGGTLEALTASVEYEKGGATGWLAVRLNSTQAPAVLEVTLTDTGLVPGVHEAALVIASPLASNSPRSVRVRVRVRPRASPVTSTIVAEPSTLVANGSSTSTITVVLRDSRGSRMASGGDGVALFTNAGSLSSVTDNGDGTYRAVFTSPTTAGKATITGSLNGEGMEDNAEIELRAGPAANVAISAGNNQTGTVGSPLPVSLQVRVTDAHGNVVSGATVQWSTSNGSASPASGQTGSNGRTSTTWSLGTTPGSQSLQASVSGVGSVTFNATADPGPVSATRSSVTAEPEEGILADGVAVSTVTVFLRDLYGNALTGMVGQMEVGLTGQAARTNVVESGPAGRYAFDVRNGVAELVTVTVTVAGEALEDQPMVEFVAPSRRVPPGAGEAGRR